MEKEDGAGNPPAPHTSGAGVSTRRTTSVMVSRPNQGGVRFQLRSLELKRHLLCPLSERMPRVARKSPRYRVLPLQLPLLNQHDPTNLVPKVASLVTGPAHPSEPDGSGRPSPSRRRQPPPQPWQPRRRRPNRVAVWMRRVPRVGTALNMSTEKAVWALMSWMQTVKV